MPTLDYKISFTCGSSLAALGPLRLYAPFPMRTFGSEVGEPSTLDGKHPSCDCGKQDDQHGRETCIDQQPECCQSKSEIGS